MNTLQYQSQFNNQSTVSLVWLRIKKPLFILLPILLVTFIFYLIYSYSFISISVNEAVESQIEYQLVAQGSDSVNTFNSDNTSVRKLVKRGNYELKVTQGNKNSFSVVSVGGFLQTKEVQRTLIAEKQRSFIGNNPSPCVFYTNNLLYSFACNSSNTSISQHVPATKDLPTYIKKTNDLLLGNIDGVVRLHNGSYVAVVTPPANSDILESPYVLYDITKEGRLDKGRPIELPDIDGVRYNYLAYKDGLVAVDNNKNIFFVPVSGQSVSLLPVDGPSTDSLFTSLFQTDSQTLSVVYNNLPDDEISDEAGDLPSQSEIVIYANDQNQRFTFEKGYFGGQVCGENRLCMWSDSLDVYDTVSNTPKLLFSVHNINNVTVNDSAVTIVRDDGIISINTVVDPGVGSFEFVNTGYDICGTNSIGQDTILCLINKRQQKQALFVNSSADIVSPIDSQIATLFDVPEIKDISIYKNYIFITPELGEPTYNQRSGNFEYNDTVKSVVSKKIQDAIKNSGLNQDQYTVVIPLLAQ